MKVIVLIIYIYLKSKLFSSRKVEKSIYQNFYEILENLCYIALTFSQEIKVAEIIILFAISRILLKSKSK